MPRVVSSALRRPEVRFCLFCMSGRRRVKPRLFRGLPHWVCSRLRLPDYKLPAFWRRGRPCRDRLFPSIIRPPWQARQNSPAPKFKDSVGHQSGGAVVNLWGPTDRFFLPWRRFLLEFPLMIVLFLFWASSSPLRPFDVVPSSWRHAHFAYTVSMGTSQCQNMFTAIAWKKRRKGNTLQQFFQSQSICCLSTGFISATFCSLIFFMCAGAAGSWRATSLAGHTGIKQSVMEHMGLGCFMNFINAALFSFSVSTFPPLSNNEIRSSLNSAAFFFIYLNSQCWLLVIPILLCTLCTVDYYLVCISFCSVIAKCCLPAGPVVSLLTGSRKLPIYILLLCEFIGDVLCTVGLCGGISPRQPQMKVAVTYIHFTYIQDIHICFVNCIEKANI